MVEKGKEVFDVFYKLDTEKRLFAKTHRAGVAEEIREPHLVRAPAGVAPTYIKTSPYQMFCWRVIGPFVRRRTNPNQKLEEDLLKAHMTVRPEEFIAFVWMTTIIVAIAAVIAGVVVALLPLPGIARIVIPVIMIVLIPLMTYFVLMGLPTSRAKTRARKIDARISSAMAFISAMSSADVNVDVIFKELARQPIYGEIRNEAAWITRDTELLGVDILTAVKKAAQRSPSTKFQDFLQGVVTTSTSGGQLKPYFIIKADQYEKEAKLDLRKKIETLGMLAETFVTVVVAFPLFLVVILAIMVLVQSNPEFMLTILYGVVGVMIPLAQFAFVFVIWNMSQEA